MSEQHHTDYIYSGTDFVKKLSFVTLVATVVNGALLMMLYNFRGIRIKKHHRSVLVTGGERVFVIAYIAMMFFFEVKNMVCLYTNLPCESTDETVLLLWLTANILCIPPLVTAVFSSVRYVAFIHLPLVVHLTANASIFMTLVLRSNFDYWIILPLLMTSTCAALAYKVPYIFQIDEGRYQYERDRVTGGEEQELESEFVRLPNATEKIDE